MAYGTVSVDSNTSIEVVPANPQRQSLLLVNMGAGVIYLGNDSSVTTATGLALTSATNLTEDSGGAKVYTGPYWAIASAPATARYWERTV